MRFYIFTLFNTLVFTKNLNNIKENYFKQIINHENINSNTFNQRYYINSKYYKISGPVILYIGGEWVLEGSEIITGEAVELAKKFNGIILGLEHRYYGKSQPFNNWSVSSLKFLSSQQALKDLVYFKNNVKLNLINKNLKWIVIGGSYAGDLAAWSKIEYPKEFTMAIASSAPVLAKFDFYEYDLQSQLSLGNTCAHLVSEVTDYIDHLFYNNKIKFNQLKSRFECEHVQDDLGFLSIPTAAILDVIQYNDLNSKDNIKSMCKNMNQILLKRVDYLIELTKRYYKKENKSCLHLTDSQEVKSEKMNFKSTDRQWTYQSCTEFGFWQSAPQNNLPSITSKTQSAKYLSEDSCGLKNFKTLDNKPIGPLSVEKTNKEYGGNKIKENNIIFVNGKVDPWSSLSVYQNDIDKSSNSVAILIENSSHTQDLTAPLNSSKSMNNARNIIFLKTKEWLNL